MGREERIFVSHARGGWTRNSTRFFSPPRHQQFPVERDEKNGARIRITRQTTAQLKLRSRDQRKRNANQQKKGKRAETRISCPILPSTVAWERALKNFFFAETSPPRENTPRRHPFAFSFFFGETHTRANHAFSKTRFVRIHVCTHKEWYTVEEEKERRRVLVGSRPSGREAEPSQPAGRPTNHSTFHSTVLSFPPPARNEVSPGVLSPGNIVWQGPPRDNISDVC